MGNPSKHADMMYTWILRQQEERGWTRIITYTITYTNAFYNRDVITITDIIDEKVEPKYDIILFHLNN